MHHTYNAAALTQRWSLLTGTPEREARQRVRVLRHAGILPDARADRSTPLSPSEIAAFLIGALASEQHLGAPDAVRGYSAMAPCPLDRNEPTPFDGLSFGEVVTELVRGVSETNNPWRAIWIRVSTSRLSGEIVVRRHSVHDQQGFQLPFGEVLADISASFLPIETIRHLAGNVLTSMAKHSFADL